MDAQEGIAPFVYNANNDSVEVTEASFPFASSAFGSSPARKGQVVTVAASRLSDCTR
jgi:hypothetical protein